MFLIKEMAAIFRKHQQYYVFLAEGIFMYFVLAFSWHTMKKEKNNQIYKGDQHQIYDLFVFQENRRYLIASLPADFFIALVLINNTVHLITTMFYSSSLSKLKWVLFNTHIRKPYRKSSTFLNIYTIWVLLGLDKK